MSNHLGKVKRIGSLTKRVLIQTYLDDIVDASRAQVENKYTDLATVWANVKQVTGFALIRNKNIGSNVTHLITIKFRADVTSENWIVYDGNRYRIRTTEDAGDEKKRFLILGCELSAKVGAIQLINTEDTNVDDNEFNPA